MWDDRLSKRNPRAPDFKCRNKPRAQGAPGCEGVIWPPRGASQSSTRSAPPPPPAGAEREFTDNEVPDFGATDDGLPF